MESKTLVSQASKLKDRIESTRRQYKQNRIARLTSNNLCLLPTAYCLLFYCYCLRLSSEPVPKMPNASKPKIELDSGKEVLDSETLSINSPELPVVLFRFTGLTSVVPNPKVYVPAVGSL